MTNEKRILYILLILLVLFVGILVLRLTLTNLAIKDHEQYLTGLQGGAEESQLSEPIIRPTDPFIGANKPEITIVAFENFTCFYCAQERAIFKELLEKYPDKVKIIWKDFVSTLDQKGFRASIAARCAQSQGRFWEFHDAIFANQTSLSDSYYKEIAVNLGLDQNRFTKCFEDQETLAMVTGSFNEGLALGVDATPYLFINNQRVSGFTSFVELEEAIHNY